MPHKSRLPPPTRQRTKVLNPPPLRPPSLKLQNNTTGIFSPVTTSRAIVMSDNKDNVTNTPAKKDAGNAPRRWKIGGFRAQRIKVEPGMERPEVGEYYHVISTVDSGDEEPTAPTAEQAPELPENEGAFKMFFGLANSGAVARHCNDVGVCDGSNSGKTLQWLRNIDQIPEKLQKKVAEFTAHGPVLSTLVQRNPKKYRWSETRIEMAHEYVSADFCRVQRDRLWELS